MVEDVLPILQLATQAAALPAAVEAQRVRLPLDLRLRKGWAGEGQLRGAKSG
jgi:hypothetical protein